MAVLATAATLALTGCGSDPGSSPHGPVSSDDQPARLCVPLRSSPPLSRPVLLGEEIIRNAGPVPAVLHSLRLIGAHHMKAVDGYVVPFRGNAIYGNGASLPARPSDFPPGNDWSKRRALSHGAVLPPDRTSTTKWQLIVAVKPTRATGGAYKHIEVNYTVGRNQYHFIVPVAYAEQANC